MRRMWPAKESQIALDWFNLLIASFSLHRIKYCAQGNTLVLSNLLCSALSVYVGRTWHPRTWLLAFRFGLSRLAEEIRRTLRPHNKKQQVPTASTTMCDTCFPRAAAISLNSRICLGVETRGERVHKYHTPIIGMTHIFAEGIAARKTSASSAGWSTCLPFSSHPNGRVLQLDLEEG